MKKTLLTLLLLAASSMLAQAVPPPAPIHGVTLIFSASTSANVTGYNVWRSAVSGGSYVPVIQITNGTSVTDLAVIANTTYYYVITAYNSAGMQSAFSNEVKVTVPSDPVSPIPPTTPLSMAK